MSHRMENMQRCHTTGGNRFQPVASGSQRSNEPPVRHGCTWLVALHVPSRFKQDETRLNLNQEVSHRFPTDNWTPNLVAIDR